MVVIFGASGHAKEIAFILKSNSKRVDYFVANDSKEVSVNGINVIDEPSFFRIAKSLSEEVEIYIGIGNCILREKIYHKIKEENIEGRFPNLAFKRDLKDFEVNDVVMGEGNIFFPGVVLTVNTTIGNHNHFNINSSISHDCRIGDFNTISPAVNIAGNVSIGNSNFFGINASIIDNTTVLHNNIIGAGATIINDITTSGTYVGTPAIKVK